MDNIILTEKQNKIIEECVKRYKSDNKITVIEGEAGTSKTSITPYITKAIGLSDDQVAYCAFTGKACKVLKSKGCKNVSTIHMLIYQSFPKPDGTFIRRKVKSLPYKLIYVDEIGMIEQDLMNDLLKYDAHFICLGDERQLKPVRKQNDNHLLDNPNIHMTELFRQQEGSDILDLCHYIRVDGNLDKINELNYQKDVKIVNSNDLSTGQLLWADQVICSTNERRNSLNRTIRNLKGINTDEPQENDRLIVNRNFYNCLSDTNGEPLTNGTTGIITNLRKENIKLPLYRKTMYFDYLICDFITDEGEIYTNIKIDYNMLKSGNPTLNWDIQSKLYKKAPQLLPIEMLYGAAITTYKSQGSQWDKVLVIEERWPFIEDEHRRMLYTACSRSRLRLVLVLKE